MRSRAAVPSAPAWGRFDVDAPAIRPPVKTLDKWYHRVPYCAWHLVLIGTKEILLGRTAMTDTTTMVRERYRAAGLTDRIKAALATVAADGETLTVGQLAPLDQFHTRGILATAEL